MEKKSASLNTNELPTIGVENVPSVYSNNMEVLAAGGLDVRIAFNEIMAERPKKFQIVRRANVVMSLSHFMGMVEVLNATAAQLIAQQQAAAKSSAEKTTRTSPAK